MGLGASPHHTWQAPAAPPHCREVRCLFFPISFLAAVEVWSTSPEQLIFRRCLLLHLSLH